MDHRYRQAHDRELERVRQSAKEEVEAAEKKAVEATVAAVELERKAAQEATAAAEAMERATKVTKGRRCNIFWLGYDRNITVELGPGIALPGYSVMSIPR